MKKWDFLYKMYLLTPFLVPLPVIEDYYCYLRDNDNDDNYQGIEK